MCDIAINKIGVRFFKQRYFAGDVIVDEQCKYVQYEVLDVKYVHQISMYVCTVRRLIDIIDVNEYIEKRQFCNLSKFKQICVKALYVLFYNTLSSDDKAIITRLRWVLTSGQTVQNGTFYRLKDYKCWNIFEHTYEMEHFYQVLDVVEIDGMYLYKLKLANTKTSFVQKLKNSICNLMFKLYERR